MVVLRQTFSAFSTTCVTTQRLRRLSGRDSAMSTRWPTFASLFSLCATNFVVLRWILPYSSSRTVRSTATTTVFSILSLTTVPVRCALTLMSFLPGGSERTRPTLPEGPPLRLSGCRLLAQNRLHLRQIAAQLAHPRRRLQLPHRLLDPEPEDLVVELLFARPQ